MYRTKVPSTTQCFVPSSLLKNRKELIDFTVDGLPFDKVVHKLAVQTGVVDTFIHYCYNLAPRETYPLHRMERPASFRCRGRVKGNSGEWLSSANIRLLRTQRRVQTDSAGYFTIDSVYAFDLLEVSHVDYRPWQNTVGGGSPVITLKRQPIELQELIKTGYASYPQEESPGNIFTARPGRHRLALSADPTDWLVLAPGVVVNTPTGVPGAARQTIIRGNSSIGAFSGDVPPGDPLYIIDGVPLAAFNTIVSQYASAAGDPDKMGFGKGGLGILGYINPLDIESMTVLKDAAATSIYGSRGAKGVVLITTKKARRGKTAINISAFSGVGWVPGIPQLLNTRQYLAMRREALVNDGLAPDPKKDADLLRWDTGRYTNFPRLIQGGHSHISNLQVSASGGSPELAYRFSAAFRPETTVFPGDFYSNQAFFTGNLSSLSRNKKLTTCLTGLYSFGNVESATSDMSQGMFLAPNVPPLTDKDGNLSWDTTAKYTNPLGNAKRTYHSDISTYIVNGQAAYRLLPALTLRANIGINRIRNEETVKLPQAAYAPNAGIPGILNSGNNFFQSIIFEPQAEYRYADSARHISIEALAGASFQRQENKWTQLTATGYTNDALLTSLSAAKSITATNDRTQYRYEGQYAAINMSYRDRFYLYLTGRRDGSSRLGPDHRLGNFGAFSAGWTFYNIARDSRPMGPLQYGKLKLVYGTTGNDQIGDYKYQEAYTAGSPMRTYGGVSALTASQPSNPSYSWEKTGKLDIVLELRMPLLDLTADWYRNRTSNQVLSSPLPTQTGYALTAYRNTDAVVQNSGLELFLTKKADEAYLSLKNHVRWIASLSASFCSNKLVSASGSRLTAYNFIIGRSLTEQQGYFIEGVDPGSGLYKPADRNGNGITGANDTADAHYIAGNTDARVYIGFVFTLSYKRFQLEGTIDGRVQSGRSPMLYFYTYAAPGKVNTPSFFNNQPVSVLDRWQKPGDVAPLQKLTTKTTAPATPAGKLIEVYKSSNLALTDASFLRLRGLSLSYALPASRGTEYVFYIQGQNLFTLTRYKGDPIIQSPAVLPPLRTVAVGVRISL